MEMASLRVNFRHYRNSSALRRLSEYTDAGQI